METAGFSDFSYGTNTRLLNQAINRLRECGSEAILGEMPKIAVIGNQSAGKSSLIEAMSGIRVPRQVGTCTRCPMEVVLSQIPTGSWKCQISLRMMYDGDGQNLSDPQVLKFGDVLTDPCDVENRLRQAQNAILNWDVDDQVDLLQFLEESVDTGKLAELCFSRNVIRLEVSGPDLVDVTFIDLPGIIANAKNEKWMTMVHNLVTDYISQSDCLILVVISMHDEIENQGAAHLARQYDRAGRRTIGVLTKADKVEGPESFERWKAIVNGEDRDHALFHGHYVTMQRRNSEDSTYAENLSNEITFFQNTAMWSTFPQTMPSIVGTVELRRKLSTELSGLIKKRIPILIKEINRLVKKTNEQSRSLPSVIKDPAGHLVTLCTKFKKELDDSMEGKNDRRDLALAIAAADARLLNSLQTSITRFGLADYEQKKRGELPKSANRFLFPEEESSPPTIEDRRERAVESPVLQSSPRQMRARSPTVAPPETPRTLSETETDVLDEDEENPFSGNVIELEEVRKMIKREKARKLPGPISAALQEMLIRGAIKGWQDCAMRYTEEVSRARGNLLQSLCETHFGRFEKSGLFTQVWQTIDQVLRELSTKSVTAVMDQYSMECRPFTQSNKYLERSMATLYPKLMEYRQTSTTSAKEEFHAELQLISYVLAYLKLAHRRFGDNVPMRVDEKFQNLPTKIHMKICERFLTGEGHEEKAKMYLEDSPELAARRKDLDRRLEILRKADQEVRKVYASE